MIFRLSKAFLDERIAFSLCHTCEHCAHFNEPEGCCVHGYPVEDHLLSSLKSEKGLLIFCKEFELR